MTPPRWPQAETQMTETRAGEQGLWTRLLDRCRDRRDPRGWLRPRVALVLRRQRVYAVTHGSRGVPRSAPRAAQPVTVSVHVSLSWPPSARSGMGSPAASITDHLGARVAVRRVYQAARHAPSRVRSAIDRPSLASRSRPAAIEPRASLIARASSSASAQVGPSSSRSGDAAGPRSPSAIDLRRPPTRREPTPSPSSGSASGSAQRSSVEPPRMDPRIPAQAASQGPAPRSDAASVSTTLLPPPPSPARRGISDAHAPAARQVSASPAQRAPEAAIAPRGSTTLMPRRTLVLHRKADAGLTSTNASARARRTLSNNRTAVHRRSPADGSTSGSPIDAIAPEHVVTRAHVRPRRALLGREAPETTTVTHAARVARSAPPSNARAEAPAETQHARLFTQPVDRQFAQPPPIGPPTSAPIHESRPQPDPAPRPTVVAPAVDVARLSEDVYQHIQRRIRIERERRGL
jgi:hypothetical protein